MIKGRRLARAIHIRMVNSWVFELDMNVPSIMCYHYGLPYVYLSNAVDLEALICHSASANVGAIAVGGTELAAGAVGAVVGGDGAEVGRDLDAGDGTVLVAAGGAGVAHHAACCGGAGAGGRAVVGGPSP